MHEKKPIALFNNPLIVLDFIDFFSTLSMEF